MPAVSQAQQRYMAMCEHGKGAGCPKGMTKGQMHDYAATSRKGLPKRAGKRRAAGGNPFKRAMGA